MLKPVFYTKLHEGVRRGDIYFKTNSKANLKLLGALFKHVFQETKD